MHTTKECEIKCDAIKTILTDIQHAAALTDDYTIRHQAESALDLIRELKGEMNAKEN